MAERSTSEADGGAEEAGGENDVDEKKGGEEEEDEGEGEDEGAGETAGGAAAAGAANVVPPPPLACRGCAGEWSRQTDPPRPQTDAGRAMLPITPRITERLRVQI
jgi:hypothetical protein